MNIKALKKLYYGFLLLRLGGLKVCLLEVKNQIYSVKIYIGTELNLNNDFDEVPSKIKYKLKQATKEDMGEVFQNMTKENNLAIFEMLKRKICYEFGFKNCYVARTEDNNEICYVIWIMTQMENKLIKNLYGNRFPKLKENEILFENRYTFEKYRGNRIAPSVDNQLCQMAKRNGFKRMIGYVSSENIASIKAAERAGHKPFEKVQTEKFFFFTIRKIIQYNKSFQLSAISLKNQEPNVAFFLESKQDKTGYDIIR